MASKDKVQGPLWTPTLVLERMMRACESSAADTLPIEREILKGLIFDSLQWRGERTAHETKEVHGINCPAARDIEIINGVLGAGWVATLAMHLQDRGRSTEKAE